MPPSQLKQLKASLRESGILGPQQSKKQKQKNAKSGAGAASRIHRNAALQGIREQFNPFEIKAPTRPAKFNSVSRSNQDAPRSRPGVTKGLGEQRRKETLLKEMQRRSKVGTLLDRRFGENDPTMTPEERAAERFARESQRRLKKESMFNLEDDEEEVQLTHLGQTITFDAESRDDFQEDDLNVSDEEGNLEKIRKRRRTAEEDDMEGLAEDSEEEGQPERKKSKNEVMKELIAKSKFHKYERQKAKEDDADLRASLDKGLPEIFEMMRGVKKPEPEPLPQPDLVATMNPDRAALLNGKPRDEADKEYDQRLKQMTYDKRANPVDRTKTEEEKAEEEAERLRQLEKERLRRMQGAGDDLSEEQDSNGEEDVEDNSEPDDAKAFGLAQPKSIQEFAVEDEDDFIIDRDLVESDSEAELFLDESDMASASTEEESEAEDDEFIGGLVLPPGMEVDKGPSTTNGESSTALTNNNLAFTYPCPRSHEHFLQIIKDTKTEDLPTVVQRIRALHHPRLHSDNKSKLATFSQVLVQHTVYLANQPNHPPFAVLENLLRHVHSMAKAQPEAVASAMRDHLREMSETRPLELLPGDLVILTGVATIFPTSDHFHAVVTPSILAMARYLGQSNITNLGNIATGAYIATLCIQYQTLAKRYIPEFMNYVLNGLCILAPIEPKETLGLFPLRQPSVPLHLTASELPLTHIRKLTFWDVLANSSTDSREQETLKLSLISTFITLLDHAADLWSSKSAFHDIFVPANRVLKHLNHSLNNKFPSALSDQLQRILDKLQVLLKQSDLARRPLLLHNHRPLAIKTAIPKFEESFNPSRHYDPDRERAELNKLKAEHKRERKGAMRELRKDANFIARESLREKREKDAEYERKYRRLVAEIQGEEGREAKAYEKEKKARRAKK
ncbi:nucleolar complex protein [Histoplasma capsulatum G186AR]|uniref:Nucleolar complex protein n=2 Tax=Ajellomyces capsulatus TaxID=5037 RepID=C0NNS9_AJECG|nr:nucleolar complex protein [Histoplasma capsulatum G186AR]EEH06589.1 nucleolar complex protein [Histoplasma capsulatum G186AR]KAG5304882.1 nucleolar complex protein [Histoplasma capsulatum]QSS75841.1 nucleolar complex protein [Histoplasma capsulatum G186AR]